MLNTSFFLPHHFPSEPSSYVNDKSDPHPFLLIDEAAPGPKDALSRQAVVLGSVESLQEMEILINIYKKGRSFSFSLACQWMVGLILQPDSPAWFSFSIHPKDLPTMSILPGLPCKPALRISEAKNLWGLWVVTRTLLAFRVFLKDHRYMKF